MIESKLLTTSHFQYNLLIDLFLHSVIKTGAIVAKCLMTTI